MENVASRFGQRLAHTEKKYRDQALKKLSAYLAKRTQWSALEWDKLWKALFYCMWMSDKRAVQDELSTNLSRLVHTIPAVDDALGFCHSFFRTMHREWHGIDGLRLDKFYSLIRKFVHETLLLLRHHDWDRALVERVVSILSSEIMSQLPNGLRLHVTDLFLTELHGAAGDDVDTTTFLLLLEPFFTLLSSEYDKTVFKRVRELVFLPMLSTYAFGPQPEKGNKKTESDELHDTDKEDDGDDDDAPKVFAEVELPFVQHRIFAIASADDTAERNRSVLYELYSHFYKATKIDSLKASQDATLALKARKAASKKRKEPEAEPVAPEADESAESKKKKKNKRRKKTTPSEEEANAEMAEAPEEADEQVVVTPEKKSKKSNATKTPVNTPVKNSAVEDETPTQKSKKKANVEDAIMEAAKTLEEATPESVKKSKKDKKKKAAETKEEEEEVVDTPTKKSKKDKKTKTKVEEMEEEVVETPTKKEKKTKVKAEEVEAVKEETTVSKKSKKEKKKAKAEEMLKKVEEEVAAALEQVALSKTADKTNKVKVEAKVEGNEVTPSKKKDKKQKADAEAVQSKEAKEPKPETVTRSGMKFRRCAGCGGIGKGLVPVGKDCCRHCERTGQLKKKALVADKKKKRKADELAASAAAQEPEAPSKKVTFGKNRALAHELSVKRLKASKTVVKELTSDIKGVLKADATSSAAGGTKQALKSKKRMKAADFF